MTHVSSWLEITTISFVGIDIIWLVEDPNYFFLPDVCELELDFLYLSFENIQCSGFGSRWRLDILAVVG